MKNKFGLDADYFSAKLKLIIMDINFYTPKELAVELERLAKTAHTNLEETN